MPPPGLGFDVMSCIVLVLVGHRASYVQDDVHNDDGRYSAIDGPIRERVASERNHAAAWVPKACA
jgi:hypothetical protein